MQGAAVFPLTTWTGFYTIIGSAAATLTGLMFVVITLSAGRRVRKSNNTIAAFGTPTVVHFGVAILIAAGLCAPWQALWAAGLLPGCAGLGGIIYTLIVIRRARHQTEYKPVLEDWLWHISFPFIAYIALAIAGFVLALAPAPALFAIGAVTLLFLFIGIHNAWDTVTYITLESTHLEENERQVS
jgi:hypothetical protein